MKLARAFLFTLLAATAMATGCAAHSPDPLATPLELTFDVTILKGEKVPFRTQAWLQPGKMILFPDGTLLADFGPSVNTRGVLDGTDDEIGHGSTLRLGGAFEHCM